MTTIRNKIYIIFFLLFSIIANSYSQQKTLQSSRMLAEADFHFDTFYKIVDCGSGAPEIHVTSFNESGRDLVIAFDILLRDKKTGTLQEIKVPFFGIKSFEIISPSCADIKHRQLKHLLKNQMDYTDMEITVKFFTK